MSVESAPALAQGIALQLPSSLDGDVQAADSPKKAGRLQHLKMRVAVSVCIALLLVSAIKSLLESCSHSAALLSVNIHE